MDYSFNLDIAKKFGVDGAIMLHNIYFWIIKNEANNKHFHDGRYWTYNSIKAFEELFPFWTKRQIERILNNLQKDGAIITGNFNIKNYDRTKWYTITKEVKSMYQTGKWISPNGEMDFTKQGNGFHQTGKPIPDNKPDNKPDNNIYVTVFNKWIEANIVKHKELTLVMQTSIKKALKKYSVQDILLSIERYSEMLKSDFEYCNYKWTLNEFLTRDKGIGYFLDEGDKWLQYTEWKNNKEIKQSQQSKVQVIL